MKPAFSAAGKSGNFLLLKSHGSVCWGDIKPAGCVQHSNTVEVSDTTMMSKYSAAGPLIFFRRPVLPGYCRYF
jgi:hypothetical protein